MCELPGEVASAMHISCCAGNKLAICHEFGSYMDVDVRVLIEISSCVRNAGIERSISARVRDLGGQVPLCRPGCVPGHQP